MMLILSSRASKTHVPLLTHQEPLWLNAVVCIPSWNSLQELTMSEFRAGTSTKVRACRKANSKRDPCGAVAESFRDNGRRETAGMKWH
jgi:hypothetical protein